MRPGDLGRQRAAGPCGRETRATSCPVKRQPGPFLPPAPGRPGRPPSSSGDNPAVSHRSRFGVGAMGHLRAPRVRLGPLGNTRLRCPEEVRAYRVARAWHLRLPGPWRPVLPPGQGSGRAQDPPPPNTWKSGSRGGPALLRPLALSLPAWPAPVEVPGQGGARCEGRGSGRLRRTERALRKGRRKTTGTTCQRSPQGNKAQKKKAGGIGGTAEPRREADS